jgi:serine/threonine protein kinase
VAKSAVQTFGKYQILERIATGGMAEIYKARLEGIGGFQRTFAIKRILPHLSQNAEYVAMLVDEAKVAGLLSHANIVQILDLGQVDGVWYIAMEYVQGPDLGAVLRRCNSKGLSLPVPHTVFTAIELLKGLEYAHQRQVMRGGRPVPLNIIHRDVSPPNILLSMQGEVKLTDFGIARASHKALETATGVIKGRFDYMSPEQAGGSRNLDQRSDLFSVGVVLYQMLTGKHPFRCESEFATIDRIRTGRYDPVSSVNPGVPFTLETIVDRALRVDCNERYPSATAFKEALDKFFHDAGFIFTHQSLALYVRGLFKDVVEQRALPAATPSEDIVPSHEDLELEFDDPLEGPTRVIDKKKIRGTPITSSDTSVFGIKNDETATLIRRTGSHGLSEWDALDTVVRDPLDYEQRTQTINTSPDAGDEQETLIRRQSVDLDLDEPTTQEPPSQRRYTSPNHNSPQRGTNRRGRTLVIASLIGALAFFGGLFVGTIAGVVAGQALHLGAPTNPPILQVRAPRGVVVLVDGEPIDGAVSLTANTVHQVVTRVPGQADVRTGITLSPGEMRLFVVSTSKDAPEQP